MKTKVFILLFILVSLVGCKTKLVPYPVEVIKTEYRDNYHRDSIYQVDSVYFAIKGDTVYSYKYKYLYRDVIIRDSIVRIDSIPYPVEVSVPGPVIYKVTDWQNFRIWLGNIFIVIFVLFIIYIILKVKKLF